MKRALVFSLLIVGLSVAAYGGGLVSGTWDFDVTVNTPTTGATFAITSLLYVDYAISGWTFGFNGFVGDAGLFDLSFDIAGVLGAFSLYSFVDFSATAFQNWSSAAMVSIAGVDIWAAFALEPGKSGGALGGHGVAGDVEIWAEVDFGLSSLMYNWYTYGWGYVVDFEPYYSCVYGWTNGAFSLATTVTDCSLAFSNLDIWVEIPFCCLDLLTKINFDCTNGFDYVQFELDDIDLGVSWFQLDDLNIKFTTQTKSITSVDFTLTLGDAVCLTPYFDVAMEGLYIVDGIQLHALLLECEFNGVTFKAGEIFTGSKYVAFTPTGGLWLASYSAYTNCYIAGADEFFGLVIDGDSCCGGLFDAGFYTFFDMGNSAGIFDWILCTADVSVGIGSNADISFGIDVTPAAITKIELGFEYTF